MFYSEPFNRQLHKMVKHTHTIRRLVGKPLKVTVLVVNTPLPKVERILFWE